MPVDNRHFFVLCTELNCYYFTSVASHTCTPVNLFSKKTKRFTIGKALYSKDTSA